MNISSAAIKSALQDYDKKMSTLSYVYTSVVGEDWAISALRTLCEASSTDQLTVDETLDFITIISKLMLIESKAYYDLIKNLVALVGRDKFLAFARLETSFILTKENMDRVDAHMNPISAARMLTHFSAHNLFSARNKKEQDADTKINNFLSKSDPYVEIKKPSSTQKALKYLKLLNINTELNQKRAESNPVAISKALKKLTVTNQVIADTYAQACLEHEKPLDMACALKLFSSNPRIKESELPELMRQAKKQDDPLGFATAVDLLASLKLDTLHNRAILAESILPEQSAQLIMNAAIENQFKSLGGLGYALTTGLFFIHYGTPTDPLTEVHNNEKNIHENINEDIDNLFVIK